MFSFPENTPTVSSMAQDWDATPDPLVDQPGRAPRVEPPRPSALLQRGPIYVEYAEQSGMAYAQRGIYPGGRHQTNFPQSSDTRCAGFLDREGTGGWDHEISTGCRPPQGKPTLATFWFTIRTITGLWSLVTTQRLIGGVRPEECISPSLYSRVRAALPAVSNRRRAVSVCSFAVRARVEPLLFYAFDSTSSAISEKSAAMLPSSPYFSARTPTRQRRAARLLPPFRRWDPGGNIGLSRRFFGSGTRPQRGGNMGSTDSTGV